MNLFITDYDENVNPPVMFVEEHSGQGKLIYSTDLINYYADENYELEGKTVMEMFKQGTSYLKCILTFENGYLTQFTLELPEYTDDEEAYIKMKYL